MIEKIVNYISKHFGMGSPEDPTNVNIKYFAEDEDEPYWFVDLDKHGSSFVYEVEDLELLEDIVEREGGKLQIVVKGLYINKKEVVERHHATMGVIRR